MVTGFYQSPKYQNKWLPMFSGNTDDFANRKLEDVSYFKNETWNRATFTRPIN